MALPTYASPLERVWYYTYLIICGLVFLFLIAPILIVIPLSFNAEPYFTFTPAMLSFDPEGYSLRWYDTLLTLGHPAPETPRDGTWWSSVWERATWVQAAKNSFWVGLLGHHPRHRAGNDRGPWPQPARNALPPS
jgi:putative spermidine/putrescine transport system permease protein